MSMMKYKNYAARVEYDQEDRIFVGRVAGIQDIVSFHGKTVDELEQAFHESVDHYLEVSERTGRPAQKPYSGNLMLRIAPELHAAVATVAQLQGISINQWASEILSKAATR
jgi:predicted HicB family RNase H-like nuclease